MLVQNAAISHNCRSAGQSIEGFAGTTRASNVSIDTMRAVWDTNVLYVLFVLYVHRAMLSLIRQRPGSRIVVVSSGAGSLTPNSDRAFAHRAIFGPVYPASETARNALTVAMAAELEPEGIPVNVISPGFTKTTLNGYSGRDALDQGARKAICVALLGRDGATGRFTRWDGQTIPW